jgi:hypothetical protein
MVTVTYSRLQNLWVLQAGIISSTGPTLPLTDLDEQKKTISTFLRYLCLFWADHLQAMAFSLKLLHEVKVFMRTCFLYWLEVLSLVKEVCMVTGIIKVVVDWCDVSFLCYVFIGSAVAVEQVFSGGRDTISLRHTSLHADTIWIVMLVKKQLHIACAKADAALSG